MVHKFQVDRECKHSRRYSALEPKCPIKKVYVDRSYADGKDTISLELISAKRITSTGKDA